MKEFNCLFVDFKVDYEIYSLIQDIATFNKMRNLQFNILNFMPSSSIPFDAVLGGSHSNNDQLLNLIQRFDEDKENSEHVMSILKRMDQSFRLPFLQLFVFNHDSEAVQIKTKNPFIYEDCLIYYASLDSNYKHRAKVQNAYLRLKNNFNSQLEQSKEEYENKLEFYLAKYKDFFQKKFDVNDIRNRNVRRYRSLCVLQIMYLEQQISRSDLRRFIIQIEGGRKAYKNLIRYLTSKY